MLYLMKGIIQVRITKSDGYYVAEFSDLPIVTQGKTLDEVRANIKEAIELYFEDESPEDYDFVQHPAILASFEIEAAYAGS
jgi:predicted RNase H-like HicB family nuclease